MPRIPDIPAADRAKPLGYDPDRDKFIYLDELVSGKEKIVPLARLTPEQQKRLVVERQRLGPDYRVQVLSGLAYNRDQVVQEILADTDFGRMTVQADIMSLTELLEKIEAGLSE